MYYRHKSNVLKLEVSTSQLEGALQPEGSALPLKGSGLQLEGSFLQLKGCVHLISTDSMMKDEKQQRNHLHD